MNLNNFIISPQIRLCLIVVISLIIFQDEISCYQSNWFKEISFSSLPVAVFQPFGSAAGRISSKFMINADKKPLISPSSRSNTNSNKRFASRSGDDDDNDKSHQDEYSAMCLLKRSPKWRSNPTLHYFPASLYSPKSYGCKNSIVLPLNISKTIDLDNNDNLVVDEDEDYLLDMNLRSDLIDSNLYNKSLETYVIIHGFLASWDGSNWMCRLKDMILNNTQANVFILDWSGGSQPMLPIDYSQSVANTKYVGELVGSFINRLLQFSGQSNANKFHLIGHSLGAHISGFIGYSVKTIGRITGLDPAGPCFGSFIPMTGKQTEHAQLSGYLSGNSNTRRLSPLSADLVVALHTDTSLFGLNENCGHYDIYVNGGATQPGCLNLGIPSRVASLLDLDLSGALSTDFTCSHSYAHKMIDTFTEQINNFMPISIGMDSITNGLQKATSNTSELQKFLQASNKKCYPMAYECRSWAAFKAGECGFCNSDPDNDSTDNQGCVFVGVMQINETKIAGLDGTRNQNIKRQIESYFNDNNKYDDAYDGLDNDGKVNNEDYDDDDGDEQDGDESLVSSSDLRMRRKALDNVSKGQHFIRLGVDNPTCLYHYQIIIAVNSSDSTGVGNVGNSKQARHSFYLQMPLNKQATLTEPSSSSNGEAKRLRDRLVQISHVNRVKSYAHRRINTGLLDSLRENFVNTEELSVSPNNLDFYTALITFRSVGPEMCEQDDIVPSKLDNDQGRRLYLCKPLIEPREIQLWASSEDQLEKVFWVTLNYMSNINEKERINLSYFFTKGSNQVKSRDSKKKQNSQAVPTLNELSRFSGRSSSGRAFLLSPSIIARTSLQPIDCLISSLDPIQSGSSSNNLKCNASGAELKYSLKMNPVKRSKK